MARPLVGHRELHLDRRILMTKFGETRPHPFERRLRRQSFAGRSGSGEAAESNGARFRDLASDREEPPQVYRGGGDNKIYALFGAVILRTRTPRMAGRSHCS